MALHGRPQCSHCHRIFTSWKSFTVHVQRNCCQVSLVMESSRNHRPDTLPRTSEDLDSFHIASRPFWPTLKRVTAEKNWGDLVNHPDLLAHLSHTCMICGTWTGRFQEILHGHYRLYHPSFAPGGVAKGAQISHILGAASPCMLCAQPYRQIHSYTVALQIGILSNHYAVMDPPAQLCCDICTCAFTNMGALYRHLCRHHGLTINDGFHPVTPMRLETVACTAARFSRATRD